MGKMEGGTAKVLTGALIAIVLIAVLTPVIFQFLGTTGASALGNTSANPNAPSWMSGVFVVLGAVGLLGLFLKALRLY